MKYATRNTFHCFLRQCFCEIGPFAILVSPEPEKINTSIADSAKHIRLNPTFLGQNMRGPMFWFLQKHMKRHVWFRCLGAQRNDSAKTGSSFHWATNHNGRPSFAHFWWNEAACEIDANNRTVFGVKLNWHEIWLSHRAAEDLVNTTSMHSK